MAATHTTTERLHAACPRWRFTGIVQPACRMVVLHVAIDDAGSPWRRTLPVVALATRDCRLWLKPYPAGKRRPVRPTTDADLKAGGWTLDHSFADATALVVDGDYGLIAFDDELLTDNDYSSQTLLACTWPVEEDGKRFEPHFATLEAEAMNKFRAAERREVREQAT